MGAYEHPQSLYAEDDLSRPSSDLEDLRRQRTSSCNRQKVREGDLQAPKGRRHDTVE